MAGPYRQAVAAEILEVPTREGLVKLEVAPRYVRLTVADSISLLVSERYASLMRRIGRKRPKKRALQLQDAKLLVARSVPTDDVGIWHEVQAGVVHRLFGLRKHGLESDQGLQDLIDERSRIEQLLERLRDALAPYAGGVERAIEVGSGADRVLIMDFGDHMLFHVRRLFRERQHSAFEIHRDGTVAILQGGIFHPPVSERIGDRLRRRPHRFRCTFRYGVTSTGDYLCFIKHTGEDHGRISLPWITAEDRAQLATIITQYIRWEH